MDSWVNPTGQYPTPLSSCCSWRTTAPLQANLLRRAGPSYAASEWEVHISSRSSSIVGLADFLSACQKWTCVLYGYVAYFAWPSSGQAHVQWSIASWGHPASRLLERSGMQSSEAQNELAIQDCLAYWEILLITLVARPPLPDSYRLLLWATVSALAGRTSSQGGEQRSMAAIDGCLNPQRWCGNWLLLRTMPLGYCK